MRFFLALTLLFSAGLALAQTPALEQAETALAANDLGRAESLLNRIAAASLDSEGLVRMQLIRARIWFARGQPLDALRWLPASSAHVPALAPQIEWLRARALFLAGDAPSATRALVERERHLRSAQDISDNRDALWAGLFATPMDSSVLTRLEGYDVTTRGWVELALLVREGGDLEAWRSVYRAHPGAERVRGILPAPAGASSFGYASGGNEGFALLLPLSGAMAATGEAVRDGFLAAASGGDTAVRVYDAGNSAESAVSAWQEALRDGASVIVGPLRKEALSALAGLGDPPVPWIALNYSGFSSGYNRFQFGLAPEDEARAAAEDAVQQGLKRALVLAPGSDWGERAAQAFAARLSELGGSVLEQSQYASGAMNFAEPIQKLLNLDISKARLLTMTATLGTKPEFEPRRREDADLVFFAARAADARLIWPQLRFFRATDLPTYTTSAAYEGGMDPELSGLTLCDMPFMLNGADSDAAELRGQLADLPAAKNQPRLLALGADAYTLARKIQAGELQSLQSFDAATGTLHVNGGVINRSLRCARIKDGVPHS